MSLAVLVAFGAQARGDRVGDLIENLRGNPDNPALLDLVRDAIPAVSNAQDRCRLGVVYALGCLATGRTEEGLRLRAQVLTSFAALPPAEELKAARIMEPCRACVQGRVQRPCKTCQGSGNCLKCGGARQQQVAGFDGPRVVRCMVCAGSGYCRACQGARVVDAPCPECGAAGLVPSPALVRRAYQRVLEDRDDPSPPAGPPPDEVEAERAVRAAREQALRSPLLARYPLVAGDADALRSASRTSEEKRKAGEAIFRRSFKRNDSTGYFYLPFPTGLAYRVREVTRSGSRVTLQLTSEPSGDPAVDGRLTRRAVLERIERALCNAFKGYLQEPRLMMPARGLEGADYRKNAIVESGAWLIAAAINGGPGSGYGLYLYDECYRNEQEYGEINNLTLPAPLP